MSDFYLGEIRNFAFGKAPNDWLPCNGQLLPVNQNQALFSLLGTAYGGNGTTNFALPDLRSRVMVGNNQGNPDYKLGTHGGTETVALTPAQMPMHNHAFNVRAEAGTTPAIAGNVISSSGGTTPQELYATPAAQEVPLNPGSLNTFGSGQPHNNLQPYVTTNYCIAVKGIYPTRS